ncbi:MAG TPA: GntR family transcriptional regulator, partial [Actinomycetota bacterium]|nr:GntR family transcriptional regulator [Actinomycetota bacterium]
MSSAAEKAYEAIRDGIVGGELPVGGRLREEELAGSIGVSRTPVREALARLREEGLVEIVAQLGTFVAPISPRAVTDAQFVREAL